MSKGYGAKEIAILAVLEAWSPFPLMELLRGEYTRSKSESLKRAARSLARKGEIELDYDSKGRLVIKKRNCLPEWSLRAKMIDGIIVSNPGCPPIEPGQYWILERDDGFFHVIEFTRKWHRDSLSLDDASRLAGKPTRSLAPEWGEREAELDRLHSQGVVTSATCKWRQDEPDPAWDVALLQRAIRIVQDRKDYNDTQKQLARKQAIYDSIEDDQRRGKKWKKGSGPRGDEDNLDDDVRDFLPNDQGRRATSADTLIGEVDKRDHVNRLLAEPSGTLEQTEEDRAKQEGEEQEETERESQTMLSQSDWTDEESERLSSKSPTDDDPKSPTDDE